jgi:hypothetical protein
VVETGEGAAQLDDDVDDGRVVDQCPERRCVGEVPAVALALDVRARGRQAERVDGVVERRDVSAPRRTR